jgi:nicotinamidase-related amidase
MKPKFIIISLLISLFFAQVILAQSVDNSLNDKILVVLHMQEDSANTTTEADLEFINTMNKVIEVAPAENVVYVKINHKILNLTWKKIFVTENINDLDDQLRVVNENIFIDENGNAFSSDELNAFIQEKELNKIVIIGRTAEECIKNSILSGIKKDYEMYFIPDAIIANSEEGKLKALDKLKKKGAKELSL